MISYMQKYLMTIESVFSLKILFTGKLSVTEFSKGLVISVILLR